VPSLLLLAALLATLLSYANAQASRVWSPDRGDGTYKNPIIHADYSDPDVIRVGGDYWMTASSFNASPGLPILHSKDLVNWKLVNHAIKIQEPADVFAKPQHGAGVWAPSIRFHKGEYYIFYGDPDFGIYMTKSHDPAAEWSKPLLIKKAKGWIDPCPLWDTDGNAYLVHAFAGSRSGIKSILVVNRMTPDGTRLLDDGVVVFDGHALDPTVEGPKFYKRAGFYYILAPAGGVSTGWQLALRSKNVYGPYERRVVMEQGESLINGPHQGGLVDTPSGASWFIHFQDKGVFGRVVHLQPSAWVGGFPVIGADPDRNGIGTPVDSYRKPAMVRNSIRQNPADSDEFNSDTLGLQWQWHANPSDVWAMPFPSRGVLRLNSAMYPENHPNLWDVPGLLLQKLPADSFTATAKVRIESRSEGERFGMLMMGSDYSYLGLTNVGGKLELARFSSMSADQGKAETSGTAIPLGGSEVYLRIKMQPDAMCRFFYSSDGVSFREIGEPFKAREGRWIGAKIGFFFGRTVKFNDSGSADIDWIRFDP
jgi:beta-xylosidase